MTKTIPIRISPFFWLTAALIGWISSQSLQGTILWIAIIFISILVHEMGHALTALCFGQRPRIELVAFGGLPYPHGPKLSFWKEFIVVFNGPLFGFFLFLLATWLLSIPSIVQPQVVMFLKAFQFVNLFWTIINLLPIMPMDGGQLLRIVLESFLGVKGLKISLVIGIILAFGFAAYCFFARMFLPGAIFFLFAFENFTTWRSSRLLTDTDKNTTHQNALRRAEIELAEGDIHEAKKQFEELLSQVKSGLIYTSASSRLAEIAFQEKDYTKCYSLLKPIKQVLTPTHYPFLLHAAFQSGDYALVLEIAPETFKIFPLVEVALKASMAASQLHKIEAALGWLTAAKEQGLADVIGALQDPHYDPIRQDRAFLEFINSSK